jgi:UDP-glucose 4-epimerase
MTMRGRFMLRKEEIASQQRPERNKTFLSMNVLVVGGAGYIGSHCVRQLSAAGHRPVVLDSLVYGHRGAVAPGVPLHTADLGDEKAVGGILPAEKIDVVMHFAAFCYVGESVTDPLKYYLNNSAATLHLLKAMHGAGVGKFVFSSTCATFGVPEKLPITETLPQAPINPYGQTKLDVENALKALASPMSGRSRSPPSGISTRPAPPRTARSARTTTRRRT